MTTAALADPEDLDACRNWCVVNGYPSPDLHSGKTGVLNVLKTSYNVLIVLKTSYLGETRDQLAKSLEALKDTRLVSLSEGIDLHGRDLLSEGIKKGFQVFLEARETPKRIKPGRKSRINVIAAPVTPLESLLAVPTLRKDYELSLRLSGLLELHYKEHGTSLPQRLAFLMGEPATGKKCAKWLRIIQEREEKKNLPTKPTEPTL